ncbi:MAG: helix-turn-helix domain-containing protein [Coriobacteriales bacterium]|nr:helix-turn-helix domain-containing protein [Coriobacteriales bacterium]
MRVRNIIDELNCTSFSVSDESLLDRDVIVVMANSTHICKECTLSLVRFGSDASWQPRGVDEGVLLVYVPLSEGEYLDDMNKPPSGVVFVTSDLSFDEFAEAFKHMPEMCAVLSLRRTKLHSAFLHSYDVQQFADRAVEVIGNPILITNSDHRLLACAGEFPKEREDVQEVIRQGYVSDGINSELEADGIIRDVRLRKHAVLTENPRFGQRWVHSIVYVHHMEMGRFDVLEYNHDITPLDLETIDYAGTLAGIMIERLGMAGERVGSGSSVLRDLITGSFVNERTMRAQLSLTNLPLDETYLMITVVGQRGAGSDYYTRAGRLVAGAIRCCLWTVEGNVLAVIVPIGKSMVVGYDDYYRAHRFIFNNRRFISVLDNNDMRSFVSEPFTELTMAAGRFKQCIELMDAVDEERGGRVRCFWEERFKVIARTAKSFDEMDSLLDKRVVAMSVYDRDHGTQYLETAILSVRHPGSPAEAAKALNVHRNTYFYRVNKVHELFYIDLKDGDDRLSLAFTARVLEGMGDRLHVDASPDSYGSDSMAFG